MKLINSFFEINSFNELETGFSYAISFNPEHLIYKAHFRKDQSHLEFASCKLPLNY
jgi:hypothetical protein